MKRSPIITDEEIATFMRLQAEGLTRAEISERTGRSSRTLDRHLPSLNPRDRPTCDRTKHLAAYQAARPKENDDRAHLQALYDANGYGFSWWPPSLMERVYQLETSPPQSRKFWNAA